MDELDELRKFEEHRLRLIEFYHRYNPDVSSYMNSNANVSMIYSYWIQ